MTEISDRYRRLSDAFAATIAGVPDDALGESVAVRGLDRT